MVNTKFLSIIRRLLNPQFVLDEADEGFIGEGLLAKLLCISLQPTFDVGFLEFGVQEGRQTVRRWHFQCQVVRAAFGSFYRLT